ncbi:MAG: transcription elongation factor GreA [Candidatus Omnitrophica bacterium]|nr:transcription elongation factor GreA [Candidatus Omnitrophota bacterium]
MAKTYLSRAKYEELLKELDRLKKFDRHNIAREIGVARDKGDLRENAEYDAAKEKQGLIEKRIHELEEKLSQVEMVENLDIDTSVINIGAIVELEDIKNKEKMTYILVGPDESNYDENKISVTSPVGRGLLGHKKGETIQIKVPAGILEYKIVSLKYT